MNTNKEARSDYIPSLTGIRGFAAMLVLICHLELPSVFTNHDGLFEKIKEFGWVGVPLFFVLSGYLITWLAQKETLSTGKFRLGRFYLRRTFRIWPLYFTLCAIGMAFWNFPGLRDYAVDPSWNFPLTTFTTNFFIRFRSGGLWEGLGVLLPLWTIASEEQFYLIWGLSFFVLTSRSLMKLVVFGLGVSLFFRLFPTPGGFLLYRIHPAISFGSLLIGCLIALSFASIKSKFGLYRKLWPIFLGVLVTLILCGWPMPESQWGKFFLLSGAELICAYLIILALDEASVIARIFRARFLIFIGDRSYCIYAIQFFVTRYYYSHRPVLLRTFPELPSFPWLYLVTDFAFIFASLLLVSSIWEVLERPLRKLRIRLRPAET